MSCKVSKSIELKVRVTGYLILMVIPSDKDSPLPHYSSSAESHHELLENLHRLSTVCMYVGSNALRS